MDHLDGAVPQTLQQMVIFRVLRGTAGAAMQPSSQAILMEIPCYLTYSVGEPGDLPEPIRALIPRILVNVRLR